VPVWQKTARSVSVSTTQEADLEVGAAAFDGETPYLAVLPSEAAKSVPVWQKTARSMPVLIIQSAWVF
jgi:hypothetical protein